MILVVYLLTNQANKPQKYKKILDLRDRFGQLKAQKQQKMKFFYKIIFLLTLLIPSVAQAQFYVTGDDPGRLRWNFIDT